MHFCIQESGLPLGGRTARCLIGDLAIPSPANVSHILKVLICAFTFLAEQAPADPIPTHNLQGTFHAFLSLKDLDGHTIAIGDLVQVARGSRVTSRVTFRFRDGSLDDETAVFTQRSNFQLISDHHTQRGPSYPHPIDMRIDVASGNITTITEKDGKPETHQDHLDLPPDLVNGLIPLLMVNLDSAAASTRVSMVVPGSKPRLVHMLITPDGNDRASVGGSVRTVTRYLAKIQIGGIAGAVAPIVGKAPADTHAWILPGAAPTLVREETQLFEGGPVWRIDQIAISLLPPAQH
jgi:hypothetical protein